MKKLHGTGVALVTPFIDGGAIDFKSLLKLLRHTAKGVDYWVVMGTTGESATLSLREKNSVLEFIKTHNPKKLPIVYGIGGNNTLDIIHQIEDTDLTGVDALLSVSPYYNKPSQAGIIKHFERIADVSPCPIILYNVPSRTGSNLTAETTLELAKHSHIIGIKEASGSMEQCMQIIKQAPRNFMVISGDDMLTAPLMMLGATGIISVLANAYPQVFGKLVSRIHAGQWALAAKSQLSLLDINKPMYEEGNPSGVKHLLKVLGIGDGSVRLPMMVVSKELGSRIEKIHTGMA